MTHRLIASISQVFVGSNEETGRSSSVFATKLQRNRSLILFIAVCLVVFVGCTRIKQAVQAVTIVVSGDTAGWIVPCGCTANQSGGMARRGTFIRSLQSSGSVIVADVGGAAAGTSPYDRAKFEAILAGELRMGLVAQNIGVSEAKLGAEYLREVARRMRVPFVNCNITDERGESLVESHRITEIAGRRIAFVGILSDTYTIPGLKIESPKLAVLKLLPKLKGPYDHLVVLAYESESELRTLASVLPEADIVVGGPTGQCIAPEKTGSRWIASATNKGKFVCSFFAEANSRTWTAGIHEMKETIDDDREQTANLLAFHNILAKSDFTAQQTSFVPSESRYTTEENRVVGSNRCEDCHGSASKIWQHSTHASAWESLVKTGSQVDSYCQQCHTTAYGLPGGFESVTRSAQRLSVGCEDCHGPGSSHVADPGIRTPAYGQVRFRCDHCHDRENSPKFTYDDYWTRIAHEGTTK